MKTGKYFTATRLNAADYEQTKIVPEYDYDEGIIYLRIWDTSNYIGLGGYTGNKVGMHYTVTDKKSINKIYPFQIKNRNGHSLNIYMYKDETEEENTYYLKYYDEDNELVEFKSRGFQDKFAIEKFEDNEGIYYMIYELLNDRHHSVVLSELTPENLLQKIELIMDLNL